MRKKIICDSPRSRMTSGVPLDWGYSPRNPEVQISSLPFSLMLDSRLVAEHVLLRGLTSLRLLSWIPTLSGKPSVLEIICVRSFQANKTTKCNPHPMLPTKEQHVQITRVTTKIMYRLIFLLLRTAFNQETNFFEGYEINMQNKLSTNKSPI